MAGSRYVVAAVARARSPWLADLASWATSGAVPVELVQCVSTAQLRTLVEQGRALSAALLDGASPAVDRDLVAALREAGVAPLIVGSRVAGRDWRDLGAVAALPEEPTRDALLEALRGHAEPVGTGDLPGREEHTPVRSRGRAPVVVVTGPGGTGASTVAIALAQGLAAARPPLAARRRARSAGSDSAVVLADLCRRADQAALHDARDLSPAVPELVELHRSDRAGTEQVVASTFRVVERGYHLLLGLRRPASWSSLRPRAFAAALDGLREAFDVVVADVEADLEGDRETGSVDVEDRNLMARAAVGAASVVVVVGRPDLSGVLGMVRVVQDLLDHGVDAEAILPVWTPSARSPRRRAELHRTLVASLDVGDAGGLPALAGAVHLPRRRVDGALRDGAPIPRPLPDRLAAAVGGLVGRRGVRDAPAETPERIAPGSLGTSAG